MKLPLPKFGLHTLFFVTLLCGLACWYFQPVDFVNIHDFDHIKKLTSNSTRAVFLEKRFGWYKNGENASDYCKIHRRIFGTLPLLLYTDFDSKGYAISKQHFSFIGVNDSYKGPGGAGHVVWVRNGKPIGIAHLPDLNEFETRSKSLMEQGNRKETGTGSVSDSGRENGDTAR